MEGKAIRSKIEKSGYRMLKFLIAQTPNPIIGLRTGRSGHPLAVWLVVYGPLLLVLVVVS